MNPKDIGQITNSMKEISFEDDENNEYKKKAILRAREYSWLSAAEEILNLIN